MAGVWVCAGSVPPGILHVRNSSQKYIGRDEVYSIKSYTQGPPSDIQYELPYQPRKKPLCAEAKVSCLKSQHTPSRVLTTHPELGSDHFQGNCSEIPWQVDHRRWLRASLEARGWLGLRGDRGFCFWKDKNALRVRGRTIRTWQLLSPTHSLH